MIALTQEKREELANYARARLASHIVHGGCSDEEDIFKIALASLMAVKAPIKLKHSSSLPKFVVGTDKVDSYHCFIHAETADYKTQEEAYAEAELMCGVLFTSPPVPEIKFPDTDIFNALAGEMMEKSLNTNGKAAKAYSESAHRIAMKAKEFRDEIKRLNGWGE